MSTNSECAFVEAEPGKWYYALEDGDAPRNAWDWKEHASAYGPFDSFDEAHRHLGDNHANPGGYSMIEHSGFKMGDAWRKLIGDAPANTQALSRYRW